MDDNSSDSEDEIKPLAKNKRKAAKAIMVSDDESSETESKGSSEKRLKREDTESGEDIDSDGDLPGLATNSIFIFCFLFL